MLLPELMTCHWPVVGVLSVWACGLRWGWCPPIPSNYTAVYSVWWCLWAVAAASTKHLHTGYLNPSSPGPTRLWNKNRTRNVRHTRLKEGPQGCMYSRPWIKPNTSVSNLTGTPNLKQTMKWVPESILLRMVRAHFRKPSSTFSPVRALVSRNISSNVHIKSTHSRWSEKKKKRV